jgi:hypothetical protein
MRTPLVVVLGGRDEEIKKRVSKCHQPAPPLASASPFWAENSRNFESDRSDVIPFHSFDDDGSVPKFIPPILWGARPRPAFSSCDDKRSDVWRRPKQKSSFVGGCTRRAGRRRGRDDVIAFVLRWLLDRNM